MYHVHCAYAEYCNRIMGTFCFLPFPVLSTSAFLLQSFAGKLASQPSSLVPHCTPYANCCTWPQPEQIIELWHIVILNNIILICINK